MKGKDYDISKERHKVFSMCLNHKIWLNLPMSVPTLLIIRLHNISLINSIYHTSIQLKMVRNAHQMTTVTSPLPFTPQERKKSTGSWSWSSWWCKLCCWIEKRIGGQTVVFREFYPFGCHGKATPRPASEKRRGKGKQKQSQSESEGEEMHLRMQRG